MQYNFCNVTISMGNYVMSQSVWGILLCHNQNGEFCYVTISMGNFVMLQSVWGILLCHNQYGEFCYVTISMGNYVMSQSVWGILLCHNQYGEFCNVTISMGNSLPYHLTRWYIYKAGAAKLGTFMACWISGIMHLAAAFIFTV